MVRVAGALPGVKALPSAWRIDDVEVALVSRGTLAGGLAGLLGCREDELVMSHGARGKPLLSWPEGAAYNVAHRAGVSLIAAGWRGAIGVDLELVRDDLPIGDIADTYFSADEAGWLRTLSDDWRALGFTIIWTIKEAVLKATGRGITDGMTAPAIPGGPLLPLLGGGATLDVDLPAFERVQVRQGMIGPAHAVACVAVIA